MNRRRVLFIAMQSPALAQLAAGLLRGLGGDRFTAESASIVLAAPDLGVARVLGELGIDPETRQVVPLDRYLGRPFDDAITLCAGSDET